MNTRELLQEIDPTRGGRSRWVRFDSLTDGGKTLLNFDPDEVVTVKGRKFTVQLVSVQPPAMVLIPCIGKENSTKGERA